MTCNECYSIFKGINKKDEEKKGWVITSIVYRILQKNPEMLDNGVTIYTHAYAYDEEEAKVIAEETVKRDFVVDHYEFIRIDTSENWMAKRMETL